MSLGCPPCKALVFGSGGAAKAVSKVLKDKGFEARILSRSNAGASYERLSEATATDCKLWVNCTLWALRELTPIFYLYLMQY